jgi:hypothetical protein
VPDGTHLVGCIFKPHAIANCGADCNAHFICYALRNADSSNAARLRAHHLHNAQSAA